MIAAWSCLAESAAMALNMPYADLIKEIGHDGSEIIFPELPEPGKRRGFHMQEIIDVAIKKGYAVTPIEPLPCSTPDGLKVYTVHFEIKRFQNHLENTRGIITGMKRKWRHAVYWADSYILDPIGKVYNFDSLNMNIDCFWLFSKIKSS